MARLLLVIVIIVLGIELAFGVTQNLQIFVIRDGSTSNLRNTGRRLLFRRVLGASVHTLSVGRCQTRGQVRHDSTILVFAARIRSALLVALSSAHYNESIRLCVRDNIVKVPPRVLSNRWLSRQYRLQRTTGVTELVV